MLNFPVKIVPQNIELGYSSGKPFSKFHLLKTNHFTDMDINGEMSLLEHLLKPGFTVFDVGANRGEWSQRTLLIEPSIHLIGFEPIPRQFNQLISNINSRSAEFFNVAISDQLAEKNIFWADLDDFGGSTFYYRDELKDWNLNSMLVKTETLDNFCNFNNIKKIDYLKIDTEGSEIDVLIGASELINNNKITALQFEYSGYYPELKNPLKKMMQILTHAGYSIFRIYHEGLTHISHWVPDLIKGKRCDYFAILRSEIPEYKPISFSSE